jgi:hypothetical protein
MLETKLVDLSGVSAMELLSSSDTLLARAVARFNEQLASQVVPPVLQNQACKPALNSCTPTASR